MLILTFMQYFYSSIIFLAPYFLYNNNPYSSAPWLTYSYLFLNIWISSQYLTIFALIIFMKLKLNFINAIFCLKVLFYSFRLEAILITFSETNFNYSKILWIQLLSKSVDWRNSFNTSPNHYNFKSPHKPKLKLKLLTF